MIRGMSCCVQMEVSIFDFELTNEEMGRIQRLDTGTRYLVDPTGYMVNSLYVKLMAFCMNIKI